MVDKTIRDIVKGTFKTHIPYMLITVFLLHHSVTYLDVI